MIIPTPRKITERLAIGFIFGYVHFATALHWLNEVGFGAGYLLAIICGMFPMLWYCLVSALNWQLKDKRTVSFPGAGPIFIESQWVLIANVVAQAVLWIAVEYLRSFFCTGFPWDMLGISQFRRLAVAGIAEYTGVYGVSFMIMLANAVIAAELSRQFRMAAMPVKRTLPWHFALLTLLLVPICIMHSRGRILPPDGTQNIRIAAIQGNIPQCREWSEEEFNEALKVYSELSEKAVKAYSDLDLILWPECAVPAPFEYQPYKAAVIGLQQRINMPILLGTLKGIPNPEDREDIILFNSAVLLDEHTHIVDYYDKMHLVPFGEYTPAGDVFPWLRDIIGMGRDLTPGKDAHVFELKAGVKAGVNICFEDVFSEISREFTNRGANVLMTITNDSWYNRSSGAEQHLSHAVFRAIENRRPILRSGNNSHTCLITPDGSVLGTISNLDDGTPFTRSFQAYDVPVYDWGTTFYARHGDVFAKSCFTLGIMISLGLFAWNFMTHRKKLEFQKKA